MKTKALFLMLLVIFVVAPSADSKAAESESTTAASCSIDVDCKEKSAPYCNITYTLGVKGNYGTCEQEKKLPPKQVVEGEDCPKGTVRQPIYANEGSEAVCLPENNFIVTK